MESFRICNLPLYSKMCGASAFYLLNFKGFKKLVVTSQNKFFFAFLGVVLFLSSFMIV